MKQFITLIFLAVCGMGIANAQEGPGRFAGQNRSPEEFAKMQVEQLHKSLDLSKAQQDSVYKYAVLNTKETQEFMKNAGGDREAMREKMMSSRKKYNDRIKSFLTKDQISAYDKLQETMQQRGPRGPRNN